VRRKSAFLGIPAALLAASGIAIGIFQFAFPRKRPAPAIRIVATAARLARGRYLFWNVAICGNCHSGRDASRYGMPVVPGTIGQGGFAFDRRMGVPGVVYSANITSDRTTGIGGWSDGEILRAIREGISRDGRPLFPIMPYHDFRRMSDEDAFSVVAYLRSLRPVRHAVPPRRLHPPGSLFFRVAPRPVRGVVAGPDATSPGYGKYLTAIAGCGDCHTPRGRISQLDESRMFAGGWRMTGIWGSVVAPDITASPSTFLARATREEFVGRFKSFAAVAGNPPPAPPGRNTVMPWLAYSGMTERDLGAIYDDLRSVPRVSSR
jgi:hypothetical protein